MYTDSKVQEKLTEVELSYNLKLNHVPIAPVGMNRLHPVLMT